MAIKRTDLRKKLGEKITEFLLENHLTSLEPITDAKLEDIYKTIEESLTNNGYEVID